MMKERQNIMNKLKLQAKEKLASAIASKPAEYKKLLEDLLVEVYTILSCDRSLRLSLITGSVENYGGKSHGALHQERSRGCEKPSEIGCESIYGGNGEDMPGIQREISDEPRCGYGQRAPERQLVCIYIIEMIMMT